MTITMYDSVDANSIPLNAPAVAGYVDGLYAWPASGWSRFPGALKVRIAVFATTNDGDVLDCEPGNCTPAQAVDWVLMRRAAGKDPIVYCNQLSTTVGLPAVRLAFQQRGVPDPHYWVANYDGVATIPAGTIGKQYTDNPPSNPYDTSVMVDSLASIVNNDPAPPPAPAEDEEDMPQQIESLAQHPTGEYSFPFTKGKYHEVAFVADDFGDSPAQLRVVFWATSGPWVHDGVLVRSGSTVVGFDDPANTYAVTVKREDSGTHPVGVCLA